MVLIDINDQRFYMDDFLRKRLDTLWKKRTLENLEKLDDERVNELAKKTLQIVKQESTLFFEEKIEEKKKPVLKPEIKAKLTGTSTSIIAELKNRIKICGDHNKKIKDYI